MKPFTLTQSSEICRKSKATLLDAIRSGRLSARKNEKDVWEIDPAELHRVYPYQLENGSENDNLPPRKPKPTVDLLTELLEKEQKERELDKQERERERLQLQENIEDLRRRLDESETERRSTQEKLTLLLEHKPLVKVESKKAGKETNLLWEKVFKKM